MDSAIASALGSDEQAADWLAALDPRTRLVAGFGSALPVVACSQPVTLLLALAGAGALLLASRQAYLPLLRRMLAMDGFLVALVVMLPFTTPGPALLTLGPVSASAAGLQAALVILLKANTVVLTLLVLVSGLSAAAVGHALARLGLPARLVELVFFTVRYLQTLSLEYHRLHNAMRARGFRPSNTWHTYRSVGYLLGMLLVRSVERAERVQQAMRCRGFRGRLYVLDEASLTYHDALFAGGITGFVVLLLMLEYLLNGLV